VSNKKHQNGSFCLLQGDLINSQAFMALTSGTHVKLLIYFYQKIQRERIKNRKRKKIYKEINLLNINFPYTEAQEKGISKPSFARGVKKLIEVGFIDIVEQGGYYGNIPSRYKISDRWRKYGTPEFKKADLSDRKPKYGFEKGHPHYPPKHSQVSRLIPVRGTN